MRREGWVWLCATAWVVGFLAIIQCSLSYASPAPLPNKKFWAIDSGVFLSNLEQRFTVPVEYQNKVSNFNAYLRVRRGWPMGKRWTFEPSFCTLIPWRASIDGDAKVFTSFLNFDFTLHLFSFLSFRAGPGIQWLLGVSSQENVVLNNGGNNLTSTFYSPGGVSNSFLFTVQTGFDFRLTKRLALQLEVIILDVANHPRRHYDGVLGLGVKL